MNKLLAALTLPLLFACSEAAPPRPPPLGSAESPPTRSAMWQLAADVTALSEILARSVPPTEKEAREVERILGEMQQLSGELSALPAAERHPLLGDGLERFRGSVADARQALERAPPDFAPARSLSESCQECHRVARASALDETRLAERGR